MDLSLMTLADLRKKVRSLTTSPSTAQLTDAEIDRNVNIFALYDMAEHMREFILRTTLTFYTKPYIDVYSTNTTDINDPLYNFNNEYVTTHQPVMIAGIESFFSQSRSQFYNNYQILNAQWQIAVGNGVTQLFAGTLSNAPVLRNNVTFSSVDALYNGLVVTDDGNGNLIIPNNPVAVGTINYVTGVYTFTYPTAPANTQPINAMTVPYVPGRPRGLLYFANTFTLRPVPDQPYPVVIEVYRRPTAFLASTQMPDLAEWGQYIAYGAAKKVLEDRKDFETVQAIMPEFHKQEILCLRRTNQQLSNDRTATIYTEGVGIGVGFNAFGWNNGNY